MMIRKFIIYFSVIIIVNLLITQHMNKHRLNIDIISTQI